MPRMEPAVTQLCYMLGNGDNYVDVAKDLSVINRKLFRQGRVYAIQNIQMYFDGADSGAADLSQQVRSIQVNTIPNTWIVHNAWRKGFAHWQNQQKGILESLGGPSSRPRWADFKIAMDAAHVQLDSSSGDQDISLDTRAGDFSTTIVPDEYKIAKYHWDDDGTERAPLIHMMGQVASTQVSYVGLIENYGDSRPQPGTSEPTVPADMSDSIYAKLHGTDELTDNLVNDIEGTNDQPPYDANEYPGGATVMTVPHPVAFAAVNVTNPVANTGPMLAPCGLLKISVDAWHDAAPDAGATSTDLTDLSVSNTRVIVTVAPGPYRGVLAAAMGQ
jgi:hypothetical protein